MFVSKNSRETSEGPNDILAYIFVTDHQQL